MSSSILRVAKLIDGTGAPARADMTIRIVDGTIHEVRPWSELDAAVQETAHDLGDVTLTPGFIDAHVHLLFTCDIDHQATRTRFETASDAELAITGARNAHEALLGGTTTVRDCGDTRGIVMALRDQERSGSFTGPRILSAGAPLTTTGGHLHWCGNTADSVDEVRKAVRQLCTSGVDLLKIMASGGSMTAESDPYHAQFGLAEVSVAVAEAHRFSRHVASHAQNAESIRFAIEAGVDTLEHCLWREADGSPADLTELVHLLEGSQTSVVVTMAGIARALLKGPIGLGAAEHTAALDASRTGSLSDDFAWARTLHDRGVNVVLASDAGVRFTPFRHFIDTIRCGVEGLRLTREEAVAMSTGHAARALGIDDQVGTVSPGLTADFVVLDNDANDSELGAVRAVYRSGECVVRDGTLLLPVLN